MEFFNSLISFFTDDSLELLYAKFSSNWTRGKKTKKGKLTYVVIFNDFAKILSYLSFYLKKLEIKEHLSVAASDGLL